MNEQSIKYSDENDDDYDGNDNFYHLFHLCPVPGSMLDTSYKLALIMTRTTKIGIILSAERWNLYFIILKGVGTL